MKKCPQCEQVYGDETNFCLSDGATLLSSANSFNSETPTVFLGANFAPPNAAVTTETKKSNTLLIVLLGGLFALAAVGAVAGWLIYSYSAKKDTNIAANNANSADKTNKNAVVEQKSDNDNLAANLKQQQDKLEREKQKLADERKILEAKKKEAANTSPTSDTKTATIIDPPTNIRAAPNGAIICIVKQRTSVNILGSTGIRDNNGTWFYTDACGKQGVIHSSQIKF